MSHKHTTKLVKKLNKRLKKVQKELTLMNLIHALLLSVILLVITLLLIAVKNDTNKWSIANITFVAYVVYYLIVAIMGNLN